MKNKDLDFLMGDAGGGGEIETLRSDLDARASEAKESDDESFASMSPVGDFSAQKLNGLVKAHNKVLALFGEDTVYPDFDDDQGEFPAEFVRQLSMVQSAASDAADEGLVNEDFLFSLDGITGDEDLIMLTGRLEGLARDKAFKRFLKQKPKEEEEEEVLEETIEPDAEADLDSLFSNRM